MTLLDWLSIPFYLAAPFVLFAVAKGLLQERVEDSRKFGVLRSARLKQLDRGMWGR